MTLTFTPALPDQSATSDPTQLFQRLGTLVSEIVELEESCGAEIAAASSEQRESLRNLVHYLALRRHELRDLQRSLSALGLSSLGRSEAHVLGNIEAVRRALAALGGIVPPVPSDLAVTLHRGDGLLKTNTQRLLGPANAERDVRIMVTMPSEAATDPQIIQDLVATGMDVMRINCAHDGPAAWKAMIDHLRAATPSRGTPLRVLMDLEGPKLRSGVICEGERVISWHPPRSKLGVVTRAAAVWLTSQEKPLRPVAVVPDACVLLPSTFIASLRAGTRISFTDHPGRERVLTVATREPGGVIAYSEQSAYLTPGIKFRTDDEPAMKCTLEHVDATPGIIELHPGEQLVVTADPEPGRPATRDEAGRILSPARISLAPAQIFTDLRPGHRVMLDDGKATAVVERVESHSAVLRITRCRGGKFKLGPEKGINLPDTTLHLPALSDDDLKQLPFIAAHADMVGFSFVQRASDIDMLRAELSKAGRPDLGLVLKIETATAFSRLPELLMSAMRSPEVGVMIARGDLATQIGYERLAEVQEEILWICEAAHVPVIWATQVLETLAKKGLPSRSEITDAAMGERAECVMLNKGPFVLDAVRLLDDILRRMAGHQSKKRSMLRPLSVARSFGSER
jgi:pyruvate kinase